MLLAKGLNCHEAGKLPVTTSGRPSERSTRHGEIRLHLTVDRLSLAVMDYHHSSGATTAILDIYIEGVGGRVPKMSSIVRQNLVKPTTTVSTLRALYLAALMHSTKAL